MSQGTRTAATLSGLSVLVLIAALWGWGAATKPFPKDEPPPACTDITVAAGERVFPDQVVISVFNGSSRNGLAGSTMDDLTGRGFVAADTGNAPTKADVTQIHSDDPQNPAVVLAQRQFKGAQVVTGDALGPGVTIVVGERFSGLRRKKVKSVTAAADAVICAAPGA